MPKTTEPGALLRRYLAGEHEAVWAELMAMGPSVREAPHLGDAWAVARETMRRARHNVELIIHRLDQIGYRFWDGKQGTLRASKGRHAFSFLGKTIDHPTNAARLAAMFDAVREAISAEVPRLPVYSGR